MFELHLMAQATPSTQPITLLQLATGVVAVILAVAGIAWKAGRALATKGDLATMATKGDLATMATKGDLAAMASKDDLATTFS